MRAEIVSIGTELLLGTITDTNASYLAQRLSALGIDCYYVSQVGDNLGRLTQLLEQATERSDLVVTTGGLGPTQDDLTREAISALLGEDMVVQAELEKDLRAFFRRRGADMPRANLKQATLIASAAVIPNPVGTAPGWWVRREIAGKPRQIVSMPGVPYEMKRMWEQEVEPKLLPQSESVIASRTLKTLGLGESAVEDKVRDLMSGANPTLAPYAKQDGVHLRITAKARDRIEAERLISGLEEQVRERLGNVVYGTDAETPAQTVRTLLSAAGLRCALLEIGGWVAGSLSPLLVAADGCEDLVASCISVGEPGHLAGILTAQSRGTEGTEAGDLREMALALRQQLGVELVLVTQATGTYLPEETGASRISAEIALVGPGEDDYREHRQIWKTDPFEARRLVGLAALNLLRLQLLETKGQESR